MHQISKLVSPKSVKTWPKYVRKMYFMCCPSYCPGDLRLVFTSEGVGVGLVVVVGVIREPSENRSHKWSQKLARISGRKIRMVLFLSILFTTETRENR